MHDPRVEHMASLHRILQYVQGTLDHGLQMYKSAVPSLLSYTDADWGSHFPDACYDGSHSGQVG